MGVHAGFAGHPLTSPAVTTAQLLFSIVLGALTLLITVFGVYVVSSTMWGDRWYRRRRGA